LHKECHSVVQKKFRSVGKDEIKDDRNRHIVNADDDDDAGEVQG
jgi:hypothetical protein